MLSLKFDSLHVQIRICKSDQLAVLDVNDSTTTFLQSLACNKALQEALEKLLYSNEGLMAVRDWGVPGSKVTRM